MGLFKIEEKKLINAIKNKDIKKVNLILKNSNENNKILDLNYEYDSHYLFYYAIMLNNIEIAKLLIEYATQHQIILKLNKIDDHGSYPFLKAFYYNNEKMVKLLIEYANKHNIILNLNERNKYGNYPFLKAVCNNNTKLVKLLIDYANQHQIILNLNKMNSEYYCPLFKAVINNNTEVVKLLIEYANLHKIILNMKKCSGLYCLIGEAVHNGNVEIVKLLIEYAIQYGIILEYKNANYLLCWIISKNSIETAKLLMKYADQHQIILYLNKKEMYRNSPFSEAIYIDNIEIVKLLIEYANQHKIILEYEKNKLENPIIIKLLENYENEIYKCYEKGTENGEIIERERLERERLERERLERERLERERLERERLGREKLERERLILSNKKNQETGINEKQNNNCHEEILPETPTLVIATNNFDGEEYDHLDIKKDEFLMVTDWKYKEGWVYGHRKDNKEEKGMFPKIFIKIFEDDNKELEKRTLKSEITPKYKISFENKIKKLRSLKEMNLIYSYTTVEINRKDLFRDAYNNIMSKSHQELKNRLKIIYKEEEGIDAGGLLRDFFYQISKEIGNPNYSLFKYSHDNSYELEINPNSGIAEPNHLQYFRFIGRIIGLAIFNQQYLSVTFSLLLLKKLLNKPLDIFDLEYVDPQLFQNLQQLKNSKGAENLYLSFSLDVEDGFGNRQTIELKPNGANIDVTDFNKKEYIDLVIENKLNNTNENEQLNALKQGFYEIIPQNISSILDEIDLKYLISGINVIDVDDWEKNTDYEGYKKDDITIINFWKCVRKFSNENRTKLLIFATGNSQVPVTGFKDLQGSGKIQHFKLKKVGTEKDLPKCHTCFNRIDLPPYTSLTIMKQKLLRAITEGMGDFSIE